MVGDIDILRTVASLLRNRGDKAAMECAQMVDRWEAHGDKDAANIWRRVLGAVRLTGSQKPS